MNLSALQSHYDKKLHTSRPFSQSLPVILNGSSSLTLVNIDNSSLYFKFDESQWTEIQGWNKTFAEIAFENLKRDIDKQIERVVVMKRDPYERNIDYPIEKILFIGCYKNNTLSIVFRSMYVYKTTHRHEWRSHKELKDDLMNKRNSAQEDRDWLTMRLYNSLYDDHFSTDKNGVGGRDRYEQDISDHEQKNDHKKLESMHILEVFIYNANNDIRGFD